MQSHFDQRELNPHYFLYKPLGWDSHEFNVDLDAWLADPHNLGRVIAEGPEGVAASVLDLAVLKRPCVAVEDAGSVLRFDTTVGIYTPVSERQVVCEPMSNFQRAACELLMRKVLERCRALLEAEGAARREEARALLSQTVADAVLDAMVSAMGQESQDVEGSFVHGVRQFVREMDTAVRFNMNGGEDGRRFETWITPYEVFVQSPEAETRSNRTHAGLMKRTDIAPLYSSATRARAQVKALMTAHPLRAHLLWTYLGKNDGNIVRYDDKAYMKALEDRARAGVLLQS